MNLTDFILYLLIIVQYEKNNILRIDKKSAFCEIVKQQNLRKEKKYYFVKVS